MVPPSDPSSDSVRLALPRSSECGAIARQAVAERFGSTLPSTLVHSAQLIATELATNAFRHGQGRIELVATRSGDRLRIEVVDEGEGQAPAIREHGDETGGFGLQIVDQLASRWSAYEGTTHVWAELDVPPDAG